MKWNENSKIPIDLIEAARSDNLILFIGSGLSVNLKNNYNETLGDWNQLVYRIVQLLNEKGIETDKISPYLGLNPFKILKDLEENNNLPYRDIIQFVKEYYTISREKNDFQLHKKLYRLSSKIITTNYDNAFEITSDELANNVAYCGRDFELSQLRKRKKSWLFKLHGCIKDGDSLVIFPSKYSMLYKSREEKSRRTRECLKNIIQNNVLLFIGTGIGDFQIKNIFLNIKKILGKYTEPHFIITNNKLNNELNSFLTPLEIDDFSDIKIIIENILKEVNNKIYK